LQIQYPRKLADRLRHETNSALVLKRLPFIQASASGEWEELQEGEREYYLQIGPWHWAT
jgi:hypothetical protein